MCQRCGTEWFLAKILAKEKMPSLRQAKLAHAGRVLTPGIGWMLAGRSKRALAEAKADRQRVIDNASCPSCGSTKFKETRA